MHECTSVLPQCNATHIKHHCKTTSYDCERLTECLNDYAQLHIMHKLYNWSIRYCRKVQPVYCIPTVVRQSSRSASTLASMSVTVVTPLAVRFSSLQQTVIWPDWCQTCQGTGPPAVEVFPAPPIKNNSFQLPLTYGTFNTIEVPGRVILSPSHAGKPFGGQTRKSFFAYARSKSKTNVKVSPLVCREGDLISNARAKATVLNDFFCSTFTNYI